MKKDIFQIRFALSKKLYSPLCDLEYFESLIDELEKERIKQDTKLKMIEKLKQKGLSDEEIMEIIKDD